MVSKWGILAVVAGLGFCTTVTCTRLGQAPMMHVIIQHGCAVCWAARLTAFVKFATSKLFRTRFNAE